MRVIRDFPLLRFRAAAWWLGRACFVIRFRGGATVVVNPDVRPRADGGPPVFPAASLAAELVLFTGPSADEIEPATLRDSPLPAHAECFGPPDAIARLAAAGLRVARPHLLAGSGSAKAKGVSVRVLPAGTGAGVIGGFLIGDGATTFLVATAAGRLAAAPPAKSVDVLILAAGPEPARVPSAAAAALIRQAGARGTLVGTDDAALAAALRAESALHAWPEPILHPLAIAEDGALVTTDEQLAMRWPCSGQVPAAPLPAGYALRTYRESDLPGLGRLYTAAYGPWRDEAWYRAEFVANPLFAADRVFVVARGDEPVATAIAWDDPAGPGVGLMHFVATAPAEQAKGLGRAVSAAVMAWCRARGDREVRLTTDDYRLRALRAYLSLGFEPMAGGPGLALRWANVRDAIAAGLKSSPA